MTGRVLSGESLQRQNVKIEDVSPLLISAIIAAEDARFCSHPGIDREAIEKAIEDNKKGGRRRGGSTITQQTAKNLFFWNGGGIARKAGEAYAALLIDALWTKKRIMEHYLNIAEWGDGIFGAQAASQARFGKTASALTSHEAALLASVLPSPNKWRLDPPSEFVRGRAHTVNARSKVTAREGYADCVLLKHPAFNRNDFRAATPPPKADPKFEQKTEFAPDIQPETNGETKPSLTEDIVESSNSPENNMSEKSPTPEKFR